MTTKKTVLANLTVLLLSIIIFSTIAHTASAATTCPAKDDPFTLDAQPEFSDLDDICCYQHRDAGRACGDLDYCFGFLLAHQKGASCCEHDIFSSCHHHEDLKSSLDTVYIISILDVCLTAIALIMSLGHAFVQFEREKDYQPGNDASKSAFSKTMICFLTLELVLFVLYAYMYWGGLTDDDIDAARDLIDASCFTQHEATIRGSIIQNLQDFRRLVLVKFFIVIFAMIVHSLRGMDKYLGVFGGAIDFVNFVLALVTLVRFLSPAMDAYDSLYESMELSIFESTSSCLRSCCVVAALTEMGRITQNPTPRPTPIPTESPTPVPTVTPTPIPTATPTISSPPTISPAPTSFPTPAPSDSPSISFAPTITSAPSDFPSVSFFPSESPFPSTTPSITPSMNPTTSAKPSSVPTTTPTLSLEPTNST